MANMTIENIGGFVRTGNIDQIIDRGKSIQSPQPPTIDPQNKNESLSFSKMLTDALEKANEIQLQADRAVKELAAGRNKNIHETMLMMEKADLSFKMLMQVRNKVVDAYREIMRMQV